MFEKLFNVDCKNSTHIKFVIFGIKIKVLKPQFKNLHEQYSIYSTASEIPQAQGLLRQVQLGNLAILKMVDKICRENKLEYWLDFGTLLGAVRHKGFIPWDDDIDIGMLRDDYEKFISILSQLDDSKIFVQFSSNGKNKCFVKVRYKGLNTAFIDIFPYDIYYTKTNAEQKKKLHDKITKIKNRLKRSLFKINDNNKLREKFKKITREEIQENKECSIENKPSVFWGIDFPHGWKNRVYDWENIFPLKEIVFEDIKLPCPYNPDFVLTNVYGDYMQIPKKNYPGHTFIDNFTEENIKQLTQLIKDGKQ